MDSRENILSRDEVADLVRMARLSGKRIGFTSGVFDVLHPGHVDYLELAREKCDLLVVGVNSDSSVRMNKGPERPLNAEQVRARVVAGLSSVDAVFIFEERNNNRNIEVLTPDLYLKAGDYAVSALSSAKLVDTYGGKVEILPFTEGMSTTSFLERVRAVTMPPITGTDPKIIENRPALFIDRDGTLCELVEYLHEPEKLKMIPGALETVALLQERGFAVVVVTNQPGIGLGYFTKEEFFAVNRAMLTCASRAGVRVSHVMYCPHSEEVGCTCRKPSPGLIERAVAMGKYDLSRSVVIGDMTADMELGRRVGAHTVLVRTGHGGRDGRYVGEVDIVVNSIADLATRSEAFLTPR